MKKILIISLLSMLGLTSSCTEKTAIPLINLTLDKHSLITDCMEPRTGSTEQLESFKDFIVYIWKNNSAHISTSGCRFAADIPTISILFRADGTELIQKWSPSLKSPADLAEFILDTKKQLNDREQQSINAIEINITHSYKDKDYSNRRDRNRLRSGIHTGMKGIEIKYGEALERYHLGYPIVRNLKNKHIINNFFKKYQLTASDVENNRLPEKVMFRMFEGAHLLIYLDKTPRIYHLHRSNQVIQLSDVNKTSTRKWLDLAEQWLVSNVHEDGRMTYRYLPAKEIEPVDNKMIRQWMATIALGRIATEKNSQKIWDLGEKNIDYNLKHFYREENGLGLIEFRGMVKLGAVALAAMAIIEHPKRQKWQAEEQALLKSVDSLWHENGSFRLFLKPDSYTMTSGNVANFYPGEALLMWSVLYQANQNPKLLDKMMKSFQYYKKWHLNVKNRKPSFIPWQTQAMYKVWQITKNEELKDFVFLMNDWLVEKMLSSRNIYPDSIGRFYNPNRIPLIPKNSYGVDHASATGVYLEGLIDAYMMAKTINDSKRSDNYRRAMLKGIRSIMQLQFQDEVDMYYIKSKFKTLVKGGIKEHIYKNEIRCDNVQHPYMGILKTYHEFTEKDYQH